MIRHVTLFSLSIIILAIVVLHDVNYLNYKSPVPYTQWKEITIPDFTAIKRPYTKLYGDNKFAYITTSIEVDEINHETLKITSYFHPSRSYVFNKNIYDKGLLRHELYHFHITEYAARLIRQELSVSGNFKSLPGIILKYQQKEDSLQLAYDEESYHGMVLGKQKKWERTLDSLLTKTLNYANPIVHK